MQITGLGGPSYIAPGVGYGPTPSTPRLSFASVDGQAWIRLADEADQLRTNVVQLRRLLDRINPSRYVGGASETRTIVGTASVTSPELAVDLIGTFATRRPREAINTDPRPFGPETFSFSGATTGTATVSGAYTGDEPESYTVVVDRVRATSTRFEILDSQGDRVRRINVDLTQWDQAFNLDRGLDISFADGNWEVGDSFTVDVEVEGPLPHDPDVAFDAGAVLEDGEAVVDGSFEVNGTEVAVFASDSVNDVLARVSALTDVEGVFDADAQMVVLSRKTVGDLQLDLGNDTSGFLSATKLDQAQLERGGDADPDAALKDVPAFDPIASGTITVNGVAITIDHKKDSLNDVLAAINASGAGATASIVDGAVEITNDTEGGSLTLDDGGTAFFATLGIPPGTTDAPVETITTGSRRRPAGAFGATAREIADLTMQIGQRLSAILSSDAEGTVPQAAMKRIGSEARRLAIAAFGIEGSPETARVGGLQFDLRATSTSVFDVSTTARRKLSEAIGADIRTFHAGMTSEIGSSGKSYLDELEAMAEQLFTQARGNIDLRL